MTLPRYRIAFYRIREPFADSCIIYISGLQRVFPPQAAPVVQRMDHRERFPPQGCSGGPTDGPSGKVSASKLYRWSNGWTIGKGFRPKAAPVVQRMDHWERFPPQGCTGGTTDGPSGKVSASKLHRWSNGWTIGKGFRLQAVPVVQCILWRAENSESSGYRWPELEYQCLEGNRRI